MIKSIHFNQLVPSIIIPPALAYKFLQCAKKAEEIQFIVMAKINYFFFSNIVQLRLNQITNYQEYLKIEKEKTNTSSSDEIPIFVSFLSPENYDDASIEDEEHIKKNFLQEIRYQNEATFNINNIYQLCILVTYSNNNLKLTFDILFPKAIVEIEKIDRPSLSESRIINAVNHGIEGMDDPRIFSLALSIYLLTMKPFPLRFNHDFFQVSVKDEMKVDILSHSISILDDQICESAQVIQFPLYNGQINNDTSLVESINGLEKDIEKRDLISRELFGNILSEVKKIQSKETQENDPQDFHLHCNLMISSPIVFEQKLNSTNDDCISYQDLKKMITVIPQKPELDIDSCKTVEQSITKIDSDLYIKKSDYYLESSPKLSMIHFQDEINLDDTNQQQNPPASTHTKLFISNGLSRQYKIPDSMKDKKSISKQFTKNENLNESQNVQNRDESLILGTEEMSVDSKLFMKMISQPH